MSRSVNAASPVPLLPVLRELVNRRFESSDVG
jgi:hypothetical protein